MSHRIPVRQKLREEIDFVETGHFSTGPYPGCHFTRGPRPKITFTEMDSSQKFQQDPLIPSKVSPLCLKDRYTETDALPSTYWRAKRF